MLNKTEQKQQQNTLSNSKLSAFFKTVRALPITKSESFDRFLQQ